MRRPTGLDSASSHEIGLCVVPRDLDFASSLVVGLGKLFVSPLPLNSNKTSGPIYPLAGAGYLFFLILVSFLLMHAPSDVQFYFLVDVVFLN